MKKTLFILSGNLSTTPRAVKAILSISQQSAIEIVLVNRMWSWAKKDQELIRSHRLNVVTLQLGRKPLYPWIRASIKQILASALYPFLKKNITINAYASNKSSIVLWEHLRQQKNVNYDIIMAHSAGSLYPAYQLSQKWNIPFVFDVEDYHPGESIKQDAKNEKARREYLMKTLLPKAAALTSASPLIWEYTAPLIAPAPLLSPRRGEDGEQSLQPHEVILNSFSASEFKMPVQSTSTALKLVWFSQKISFGRGLEQLFEALTSLPPSGGAGGGLHLTLIGDMDPEFKAQIIKPFLSAIASPLSQSYSEQKAKEDNSQPSPAVALAKEGINLTTYPSINLRLVEPLSQPNLHAELARHDVGLALEFNASDLNRQLCLTNKIMAYAQAGLYILATDTPAQQRFMEEHPGLGIVCGQDKEGMEKGLRQMMVNSDKIKKGQELRFEKGKDLAWEKESSKLVEIWRRVTQ